MHICSVQYLWHLSVVTTSCTPVCAGDMAWSPMRDEFTSVLVEPPRKEIKLEMQRDLGLLLEDAAPAFPTSHHPFSSSSPMPHSDAAAANGAAAQNLSSRGTAAEAASQQQPNTTKGRHGSGTAEARLQPAQQSSADSPADFDTCGPATAAPESQQQDSRTNALHVHSNEEAMTVSVPPIPDSGACSTACRNQGDRDHDRHVSLRDSEGASPDQHQRLGDFRDVQQGGSNERHAPGASHWHADVRLDVHGTSFHCHRLSQNPILTNVLHVPFTLTSGSSKKAPLQGPASSHCTFLPPSVRQASPALGGRSAPPG